jgi:hypothetical protein
MIVQLVDSQIVRPLFLVVESGRCCDGEIYIAVRSKNKTLKEAKEDFIEAMKVFLGYEEEEEDNNEEDEYYWTEDHDSFEETYKEEIDEGVFIDYDEPYILRIVEK